MATQFLVGVAQRAGAVHFGHDGHVIVAQGRTAVEIRPAHQEVRTTAQVVCPSNPREAVKLCLVG
eukprot:5368341-Prymnesium_polylepis.3